MKKAKLFYLLSEAGRKDSILKGGDGNKFQTIEVEVTPEIISLSKVNEDGEVWLPVGCSGVISENSYNAPVSEFKICERKGIGWLSEPYIGEVKKNVYFDTLQTAEQLISYEKNRIARLNVSKMKAEEKLKSAMKVYEKKVADYKAKEGKEKAEELAKSEAMKAEKKAREKERTEWINVYGSQYLKDCLEMNVKANLEYVVERAAMEHPGFIVDYADNASWQEKMSPSLETLEDLKKLKAAGVDAEIVWLTSPARVRNSEDDEDYAFESCEAIHIKNYLGIYDLIQEK